MFANNFHFILLNYMFIITSKSLALFIYHYLSICLLFHSLIQSVNGAQFLNTVSLFPLFNTATFPVFETVIVPLAAMNAPVIT